MSNMPSPICRHPRTSDSAIPRCFRCRQDDINSQTSSQPRSSNDTTQRGSQDTNHGQVELDETVAVELRALNLGYLNVPAPDRAAHEEGSQPQLPRHYSKHRRGFCDFWLPAFVITAPLPPISLWLLFILLRHRLSESQAALPELLSVHKLPNCAFTLLRYPSTRILFVSGLASSFAPYLGASFMTLWVFRVGRRLLQHTEARELAELPDPNQYGHMLCLLCALPLKIVTYMWSVGKTDVRVPIVLRRAALILTLTCLFSGTIIINDIVLGYTTRARLLDRVRLPEVPWNYSLRVSEECLSLNRSQNVGMPCSRNYITWAKDREAFTAQQSEIMNIAHDQSERVTIRMVPDTSDAAPGVVLAIPKTKNLPLNRDFQASTIGARTTCRLRTDECKYSLTGPDDNYWIFNCTSAFRGVFGKKPPTSFEPDDPDTPPLISKPTSQLLFGFFTREDLQVLYNPQGANATGFMPEDPVALPNSKLINPVHVGIAARLPLTSQSPDADFEGSPGFFTVNNDNGWYSFVLSCSYEILEVDYIWSKESIRDLKTKPAPGGIIAEIYHGYHVPKQITQLDLNLQDAMVQAAMEDNTEKLLKQWSDLYSRQVMSVVGAFLVPAPSLLEQVHESILVTEVAIPPLVLLITAGLGYALFGIMVFISAWLATMADIADFPRILSIQGLANFAFRSPNGSTNGADAIEPLLRPVWVDYAIDSDQPSPETRSEWKVGIAKRAIGHALSVVRADRRPS